MSASELNVLVFVIRFSSPRLILAIILGYVGVLYLGLTANMGKLLLNAMVGFDSYVDDLSNVEMWVRISKHSPCIACGVHVGKDAPEVGAGDQGIRFGYASEATEDCRRLTDSMATRGGKTLTAIRKLGELWWLRPDGKTQIVMISTQHIKPSKATSCKEVAGYTGIAIIDAPQDEVASFDRMRIQPWQCEMHVALRRR